MSKFAGIWAAVVTPIDVTYSPDVARAVPYYRDVLEDGCDGVNLLGTTGEAMSFSARQRIKFMEAIAASGLPMERIVVGTGASSLNDAVALTSCAFAARFSAALIMPPFFFRDATDPGIVAFLEALFRRTDPRPFSVLLYNFPRMSGITFHADLVDTILKEFPGIVAGMKDSSNDAQLQAEVLGRHPDLAVFPGSERDLPAAKKRGAAGCISGSVSLWPELARKVFGTDDGGERLSAARVAVDAFPFIPAVRHLIAHTRQDERWERAMLPLQPLSVEQRTAIERAAQPYLSRVRARNMP